MIREEPADEEENPAPKQEEAKAEEKAEHDSEEDERDDEDAYYNL